MNADSPEAINQTKREHLDLSLPKDAYTTIKKIVDGAEGDVAEILRSGLSSYKPVMSKPPNLNQAIDKVYRFYLPAPANSQQFIDFRQKVELIRQANPQWEISPELPNTGEEEAIVMMYKGDDNYLLRRSAYVINQSLFSFLQDSYDSY